MNIKFFAMAFAVWALLAGNALAQADHDTMRSKKNPPILEPDDDLIIVVTRDCQLASNDCNWKMSPNVSKFLDENRPGDDMVRLISIEKVKGTLPNRHSFEPGKCYSEQNEVPCPEISKQHTE